METIQKYLEEGLFIEIDLHYKKDIYYAWGHQERIEKYFSYKIKDLANETSELLQKSNNHRVYTLDEYVNDNIYNSYEEALNAAVNECDEYLNEIEQWKLNKTQP